MFTKYTSVKLPENYSGSRFKSTTIDTEMKTHRPKEVQNTTSSVKTSVSPSFKNTLVKDQVTEYESENEGVVLENDTPSKIAAEEISDEHKESPTIQESNTDYVAQSPFNMSELTRIFERFKADDILLLVLILILSKDGGEESPDALILLALLLLYR